MAAAAAQGQSGNDGITFFQAEDKDTAYATPRSKSILESYTRCFMGARNGQLTRRDEG